MRRHGILEKKKNNKYLFFVHFSVLFFGDIVYFVLFFIVIYIISDCLSIWGIADFVFDWIWMLSKFVIRLWLMMNSDIQRFHISHKVILMPFRLFAGMQIIYFLLFALWIFVELTIQKTKPIPNLFLYQSHANSVEPKFMLMHFIYVL